MIVSLSCTRPYTVTSKRSKLEFEVVDETSTTSTISNTPWGNEVSVLDEELRQLAIGLEK
jgi:hypothetical protein